MPKHTGNFHIKGYLMLHHLAGATIQVANLVIAILQEDGNEYTVKSLYNAMFWVHRDGPCYK